MEKITYILGAGASALALPIIRKGNEDGNFSEALFNFTIRCEQNFETSFQEPHVNQFRNDIRWLAQKCLDFSTPDTFAKYLYHTDKNELKRLKAALIGFFVIEQSLFNKRDKRANVFITSLIEESGRLPKNVGFISWNYDVQLQIASNLYRKELSKHKGSSYEHQPPLFDSFPHEGFEHNSPPDFNLVQLNGIAGLNYNHTQKMSYRIFLETIIPNSFSPIIRQIYDSAENTESVFTFAWENLDNLNVSELLHQRMDHALEIAYNTTILVIIGYSFPFFNRKIDNDIFNKLLESGKLRKIYFQDPYNDGLFLKSQFNIPQVLNGVLEPIQIIHIKDASNYYIPYEL
jgi:hypothetical protein